MTSMIVKAKNSSDFDVMALAAQYLPVDNKLLDFANGNDGVDPKSDESKSSKNEHFTYRKFKTILDIPVYFSTNPVMISKATLENAKSRSGKILLIADEGMRKVVLDEELPRTSKAEIKAE
jgi:hypothetical protein